MNEPAPSLNRAVSGVVSDRRNQAPVVFKSGVGRICTTCGLAEARCRCRGNKGTPTGDGVARVRRETKGRGGKTVTTVSGIPLDQAGLRDLATALKRRCGAGGSLKDMVLEIQGDHVEVLMTELVARGFKVKRSGG